MRSASDMQAYVLLLAQQDNERSWVRAKVDGLVDGNPPYKQSELVKRKMAAHCNCNWGTARAYLESGSGAFYDLFSQSPGAVAIETDHGDRQQQRVEWGRILSEEADLTFATDVEWDADVQLSQNEMVLHGNGPLYFEDEYAVFPRSVQCGYVKVPDGAPSNTRRWEMVAVFTDYYPPGLYKFIMFPEAAERAGWNVEYTRAVIQNACDIKQP